MSVGRVGIWSRLLGIAFVFTFIDVGIYQILDLVFPNLDENLETNIGRALYGLAILAVVCEFFPESRKFYRLPRAGWRGWLLLGVVFVLFVVPGFIHGELPTESVGRFFDVLLFSLMIGVSEEFLCRGLVFHLFTRIGFWTAVNVSSISFGLMHFYNLSSGRDFNYTVFQVVNAGVFGYLAVGMMILTGSIWVPVVFHGLVNFPLVTIENLGMGDMGYGWFDVVAAFITGAATVGLGLVMIWARVGWPKFFLVAMERFRDVAVKFKLVERE